MTQCERLLAALRQGRRITQQQAKDDLAIARLSPRIGDLEKLGHTIDRKTIEVPNRYGEVCRVTMYWLVVKQAELELGNNGEPIKEYSEDDWRIDR